ncbi:MAG TPA: hypothetical protein VN699_03120 [Pirellulales bacterium]|nr:hypothetical protein [Pirellulales bacterium]
MPEQGLSAPAASVDSRSETQPRNPALRRRYLTAALAWIPRLLGAIDRNPYRPTYGCFDREFWHYRTSSFPSEMHQEGVLPLALVYAHDLPGNRWRRCPRVRELAIAALKFSARSAHADGSCDDYYPFERALGAAVFSLQAAARAYELLELDEPALLASLERRARWIIDHDESGRLANHQALAALGLARLAKITGQNIYRDAARRRVHRVLDWQSSEGWFEEYGGADPGYQTVTIDCLAKLRRLWNDASLDGPLRRAVEFAGHFLHPDDSYGGEYGSRGTYHFYPHGFELLTAENAQAARLADGFLRSLAAGTNAYFDDDRMYVHRLGNLIEAYLDWAPAMPAETPQPRETICIRLPDAGLFVRRDSETQTVISAARGGVFKHFAPNAPPVTDAGLIVQMADGIAVSQSHDRTRSMESLPSATGEDDDDTTVVSVSGPLHWVRFETATPLKQAVLQVGMATVGRFCRTLVRRLLQRRLITGRRESPIRLTRSFEFLPGKLRVVDRIELLDRKLQVERMSFAGDLQAAYVAAADVYQDSVLQSWTDLQAHVAELNERRSVTIVREL